MKKVFLFAGFYLFLITGLLAQSLVTVYHENFEQPSLDDSVTSTMTVPTIKDFSINTRLQASGLRCDSGQVKTGVTEYLTTITFNTTGNFLVRLYFDHICKVDLLDIATLEVSNNGGSSWTQLTGAHYLGTGTYAGNGNRFCANSYPTLWAPANSIAVPQNSWWKNEIFDISNIAANSANVKVRFKLSDGGQPGPNGNRGWFIDNIIVKMALSELDPPTIVLGTPIWQGVTFNSGPYSVKAKITDASGIDTAKLVYSINGNTDNTIGMNFYGLDTFQAFLPALNDSDVVCYHIEALDGSPLHNQALNPTSNCISLAYYEPFGFPYNDNFDAATSMWTPGPATNGSEWQWGSPTYGVTNSTHSPPKCYDVNLSSAYANNANCSVISPPFNFDGAYNARLSFWVNYRSENNDDGTRLEYTTNNGATWTVLGTANDPLGVNWYTHANITSSSRPGWANNSNGWKQAKYKLSVLNNQQNPVRFRFVFTSDAATVQDGFSFDDFSLSLPAPQEAAINNILTPGAGSCGMGNETVSIQIINAGLTQISGGLTASYKKAGWAPVVTETVPSVIPAGDTIVFTFATPVDLSAVGADSTFNLKAWVSLVSDPNHGDDTTFKTITSKFIPNAPNVVSTLITYGTSTTITAASPHPITWYNAPVGGIILGTGYNYTTPILYGTTIYYPQCVAPNGCVSARAQDTVYVGQAPPYDGAATDLISPVTGYNLTNNQIVRTRIWNYGTQPASNFPIKYKIDNGPVIEDTVTSTLQPNDSLTFTFTVPADLSSFGVYWFKSWVEIPGDLNHVNDTVIDSVENKMFVYCTSSATSTGYDDIGNVTISNLNNGNPLPYTSNPAANLMYTNFTSLPPVQLTKGQTYPISVTQIHTGSYYNCCVKVFVDWNYDGTFTEATETAFASGPLSSGNYVHSGSLTVPITAVTGKTRFRVVLVETSSQSSVHPCGTYTWGETEDYTAMIAPQLDHDAGITQITQPPLAYPQGYSAPVEITMKNFGLQPITSVMIYYQIDNNPPVDTLWNGNLLTNNTVNVLFPVIPLPTGQHGICAWTALTADSNTFNDTVCRSMLGIPVDTLPYYDNFDGTVKFTTNTVAGTNWIHGAPSPSLYPNNAHSAPNVWGTNLNTNNANYTGGANCELITQIFDFTNAINAKLSFWLKYYTEQAYDGMRVEYSLDAGTSWYLLGTYQDPLGINWYNVSNIYSSSKPAFAGTTSGNWVKSTYVLSNFNLVPTMRFRFVFTSDGSVNYNGVFMDDFRIVLPYHKDAGIDTIYTPAGESPAGTQGTVKVRVNNFGMDTLNSIPVTYLIQGQTPVTETWTGTLFPGGNTDYTFTTTFTIPEGSYTTKAWTSLPNDGDHINDTAYGGAFGIPVYPVPYEDNFDSIVTFWYSHGSNWEHGSPSGTSINTAYSAPYCWKTNINGPYERFGPPDYLYSPVFDISQGVDSLIFYHISDIYSGDIAKVEYLSNTGWKVLGIMGDPNAVNWYNSGSSGFINNGGVPGWHKSGYDLKILSDLPVLAQFRFYFHCIYPNTSNNRAGWAIDNFRMTTPKIPQDAGVIQILSPSGSTFYGAPISVQVKVQNFGTDTLTVIPIRYQMNGLTIAIGTCTDTVPPDSTTIFTFPSIIPPYQTSYDLCAYTDVPFDTKFANDTTCAFIAVVAPPVDIALEQILLPLDTTLHWSTVTVKVRIKNYGSSAINDIPLEYTVGDTMIKVSETWHGSSPLQQGESLDYTFTQPYSYSFLGWYYLCVYSQLTDDGYKYNDTICKKFLEHFTALEEYTEDDLYLLQNIPNPADGTSRIVYHLPSSGDMVFEVVNFLGQTVYSSHEKQGKGEHIITLDTKDYPAGLYYYYLIFDDHRLVRKMVIKH